MFDESLSEAWSRRYGNEPPEDAPKELARLLSHRSVRRFSEREVPEATVQTLMAAAQSAATSSNLQLWSAVSVQDPKRREQIAELCADQTQIHQAGWFFAFLADHNRLVQAALAAGEKPDALDFNEFYTMAVVDASLAAERMVCAAEALGLGICYIGALRNHPRKVCDLLNLPKGTFGVFGLCIGWPNEGETAAIKPRLTQEAVWFREQYDQSVGADEYHPRMTAFYEEQGMKGEFTWAARSGRRATLPKMSGRDTLKAFLAEQGMDIR